MRISRLFTPHELIEGATISLDAKQSHYLIHVLRVKASQQIIFFNGFNEHDYTAEITAISKTVNANIIEKISTHNESRLNISITQALSKNDHMDFMIQKCAELGVQSFKIFNSERTQIPLKSNKLEKKLDHWSRIAQSACEQCGRSIVPSIQFYPDVYAASEQIKADICLMLDFEGGALKKALQDKTHFSVDILLGSEGGLSPHEISFLESKKFTKIRLGPRILRTETAAITATSLVQMLMGDLT